MELIIPGMTNHVTRALDTPVDAELFDEDDVRAGTIVPTVRCTFGADDFSEDEARVMFDIAAVGDAVVQHFAGRTLGRADYDELADGIRVAVRIARVSLADKSDCGPAVARLGKNALFGNAAVALVAPAVRSCLLDLLVYMRDTLREELASRSAPIVP